MSTPICCCYNKIPEPGWFMKSKHVFGSQCWKLGFPRCRWCQHLVSICWGPCACIITPQKPTHGKAATVPGRAGSLTKSVSISCVEHGCQGSTSHPMRGRCWWNQHCQGIRDLWRRKRSKHSDTGSPQKESEWEKDVKLFSGADLGTLESLL